MVPLVSPRQLQSLKSRIDSPRWYVDEQLWSFLVASLIAECPDQQIPLFCGEPLILSDGCRVACEAEPISTRSGAKEGNTVLDIAFGHVGSRSLPKRGDTVTGNTLAGITYSPVAEDSWVCFVEAKMHSDVSGSVTNDPLRNQLTRVIENLLGFQALSKQPRRVYLHC